MSKPIRVVHYLNQFFGGIGAESAANFAPESRQGPIGPGLALESALGDRGQVVGTVICGDNTFAEQEDQAAKAVLQLISAFAPDLVIAGPAFQAGRYGVACGRVCYDVKERLGRPAITAMHPENPGVDLFRTKVLIAVSPATAAGMKQVMAHLADLGTRIVDGKPLGSADEDGYFPQGIRRNRLLQERASTRAVRMLVAKLRGEPYQTELALSKVERIPPAAAVAKMRSAKIALVTEAGIVPKGNPGKLEVGWASQWQRYSIAGLSDLTSDTHQAIHAGYDNRYANEDPDRVVPLDVLADLLQEGMIGTIHDEVSVTSGMATFVGNAERFGREIGALLQDAGVDGVILTGTWGTGTRCGAAMAKEIERAGIPAAIITPMPAVAQQVGAQRIVVGTSIMYPTGDPSLPPKGERAHRRRLVETALRALETPLNEQRIFSAEPN